MQYVEAARTDRTFVWPGGSLIGVVLLTCPANLGAAVRTGLAPLRALSVDQH